MQDSRATIAQRLIFVIIGNWRESQMAHPCRQVVISWLLNSVGLRSTTSFSNFLNSSSHWSTWQSALPSSCARAALCYFGSLVILHPHPLPPTQELFHYARSRDLSSLTCAYGPNRSHFACTPGTAATPAVRDSGSRCGMCRSRMTHWHHTYHCHLLECRHSWHHRPLWSLLGYHSEYSSTIMQYPSFWALPTGMHAYFTLWHLHFPLYSWSNIPDAPIPHH